MEATLSTPLGRVAFLIYCISSNHILQISHYVLLNMYLENHASVTVLI